MNDDTAKKCTCGAVGLIVGGLLGAAIALLYAPQSGRETRKDIQRTARRLKNSTADLIEDTIDDVSDFVNDLREKAADIVEQGAELSDKAKHDIMATLDQAQKAIEKKKQEFSKNLGL